MGAEGRLMAAIPERDQRTVAALYSAVARRESEPRRTHLGASVLGRECRRALWYAFRWADEPVTDGRVFRLFRRGKLEEDLLVQDLTDAGLEVHAFDERGRQFRFSGVGGHVGGSMDGAALGVLEAPKTWHVLEIKTHNAKSYRELLAKGVKESKPEHWAQVQLYMHWSGMERALYVAVCKDDDYIHTERVHYDKAAAEALMAKAEAIVKAAEPLERLSEQPEFYVCKWCPARGPCHERRLPAPSCRTCAHATPETDGEARWSCAYHHRDLTPDEQRVGCLHHVYIPALVPGEQLDASVAGNWASYRLTGGLEVKNGTATDEGVFASAELYEAQKTDFSLLSDPHVQHLRTTMGARIDAVESC